MSTLSRCLLTLTLALALAVGALLAACDGDGAKPAARGTPRATATATAEPAGALSPTPRLAVGPSPAGGAQAAPGAPAPTVPDNVDVLALGEMSLNIGPGDSYQFDPLQLAQEQDVDVPPCAAFLFLFGWQVQQPYPPEGVRLRFDLTRMGSTDEVASGPVGEASIGCGAIDVVNESAVQITVEVRYGIGEVQG